MRPSASASIQAGAFALLLIASIGLKAAAGPPPDGRADFNRASFEKFVHERLNAQGFTTSERKFRFQSTLFVGRREGCRIAVRDAREGTAAAAAFTRDAVDIGPVHYLYRGRDYDAPPAIRMRIGRLETEIVTRLGVNQTVSLPVALAASPGCGAGRFGFDDVRLNA